MDTTQILALLGMLLGGGSGLFVLIKSLIDKYGKGPAERQSEVAFGVGVLEKQIERSANESARWLDVEKFLREELRKANADTERVQDLLDTAREQLEELREERDALHQRQQALVRKYRMGEKITLADITGQEDIENHLGDLEDTFQV